MDNSNVLSRWKEIRVKREFLLLTLVFLLITAMFALFSLPGGDDWGFFRGVVQRMLTGESIYTQRFNGSHYHYPPWVATLLIPLGILPFAWGRALLCTLSLLFAILIARRFQMSIIKQALVLLSPPMLYLLLHGQIDALALGVVLLPPAWWAVGSITKPQVTLGLIFGVPRSQWLKAVIIGAVVFALSLILFGLWPLDLLRQPKEFAGMGLNIWGGLWPYQLPLGLALVFRSWQKKDDRYLIASSPFFMPYAATSSLLGPWIALSSMLEDWQAAVVLVVWWIASFSRLV